MPLPLFSSHSTPNLKVSAQRRIGSRKKVMGAVVVIRNSSDGIQLLLKVIAATEHDTPATPLPQG